MRHIADETPAAILLHGLVPAALGVLTLFASIAADLCAPGRHWTQRAGAVLIVLGAYVAYIDSKKSTKFIDGTLYLDSNLPYKIVSVAMVVVGTLCAGYGDILL